MKTGGKIGESFCVNYNVYGIGSKGMYLVCNILVLVEGVNCFVIVFFLAWGKVKFR